MQPRERHALGIWICFIWRAEAALHCSASAFVANAVTRACDTAPGDRVARRRDQRGGNATSQSVTPLFLFTMPSWRATMQSASTCAQTTSRVTWHRRFTCVCNEPSWWSTVRCSDVMLFVLTLQEACSSTAAAAVLLFGNCLSMTSRVA